MKNKKQDPYNVQLADLANELGGNMAVEYYNVSFTLTKEHLQDMKDSLHPFLKKDCYEE